MRNIEKHGIIIRRTGVTASLALLGALVTSGGCVQLGEIGEAVDSQYHMLSPATGGVYITIKRHATNHMINHYEGCRQKGKSASYCGTSTLGVARGVIKNVLRGRAKELWNGQYSVFGYHPDVGKGFRDEEGPDFATAVSDLKSRGHQCLRIHWKPSGTNWTTVQDQGVVECSWGTP